MSTARVLVVDDKPMYVELFRRIVPREIGLVGATSGEEALRLLQSEPFDVVVADVRMPGVDGLTLLERVKAERIDVAVIMITAYGTIPGAVEAMRIGAVDYLTKPFELTTALDAIERALARRSATLREQARADGAGSRESVRPLTSWTYREVISEGRNRTIREYLVALLRHFQGNVTHAAERAAIERESFHRLLKRHDVRAEDFRPR